MGELILVVQRHYQMILKSLRCLYLEMTTKFPPDQEKHKIADFYSKSTVLLHVHVHKWKEGKTQERIIRNENDPYPSCDKNVINHK